MEVQAAALQAPSSSPAAAPQSPWHSPVPYLFGGLAAMLGLIAFALFILACSYWKLSGDRDDGDGDLEAGDAAGHSKPAGESLPRVYEEKCLVIMAGEVKPTFLATPVSSRTPSFGSCSSRSNSTSTEKSSASEMELSEER